MKHLILGLFLLFTLQLPAQYTFTDKHKLECTPVENQQRTGSCWSFTTISFLESELLRQGKPAPASPKCTWCAPFTRTRPAITCCARARPTSARAPSATM